MKKNSNEEFKVDFIGVGAPKSGTSWVAECLKEHPQICLSSKKEINFFNKKYVFYRKNEPWRYLYGMNWYKKHFHHCKEGKIKGEFSVQYLADLEAPRLIFENFPEVKILMILRNPIERLYSHYLYAKSQFGLSIPFGKVIEKEKDFVRQGFYYQHIKKYLEYFPRKRILIMIYEDIEKNPHNFIKKIYKFLKVDENFVPPSLYQRVNPTPKNLWLWNLGKKIKNKKIKNLLKKVFFRINKRKTHKIPTDLRERLNLIYFPEIKKLEKLLNKDLSFWK